jgi:hypothetical protein
MQTTRTVPGNQKPQATHRKFDRSLQHPAVPPPRDGLRRCWKCGGLATPAGTCWDHGG